MTWRAAQTGDVDWITALLRDHIQTSMFLLDNLQKNGLGSDAPYGLQLWCLNDREGIFAITNSGSVMVQAPTATTADWRALSPQLEGREIGFVLGDAQQSRAFMAATGLAAQPTTRDADEPGFHLHLDDLVLDARPGEALRPFSDIPYEQLLEWGTAYTIETTVKDPKIARELTERHTAIYLERDSHRLLYEGDRPVLRTGINAQAGDVVQIGGVYTPPQLRGQGYARRAVAYHLDELRQKGVKEAVLFAASDKAAQAYRAIGCKPAGRFAVVVYDPPATLSQAIERGDC